MAFFWDVLRLVKMKNWHLTTLLTSMDDAEYIFILFMLLINIQRALFLIVK